MAGQQVGGSPGKINDNLIIVMITLFAKMMMMMMVMMVMMIPRTTVIPRTKVIITLFRQKTAKAERFWWNSSSGGRLGKSKYH